MRLIDADALKDVIWHNVYLVQDVYNSRDSGMFWTGGIEKAIDEAPTIDVEPIRYGTWIKIGMIDRTWAVHRCSACGYQTIDNGQYCTECGARMKEKEL